MILKELIIENFRCYYGKNTFEFSDGLTLVIGDNGDGKTTVIEAFEWLFNTSSFYADKRLISKKQLSEMHPEETGTVKIALSFDHEGDKRIVKSFDFEKDFNGNIKISNKTFIGYNGSDFDRLPISSGADLLNQCFETSIRKYSLFKGESELNVFNKPEALQYLIQTFSDIKDFDPYIEFTNHATEEAEKVYRKIIRSNKSNEKKERVISANIKETERKLNEKRKRLGIVINEIGQYESKINDFERNKDASQALNHLNDRIKSFESKLYQNAARINENYSIRLLDEEWILCGFTSILDEYSEKVSKASKLKREIEQEERLKQGQRLAFDEISASLANKAVPLPLTIPDEKTMQELLNDEICKVCGRSAPKGSEPYIFMKKKLDELRESNQLIKKEKTLSEEIFPNNFLNELDQKKLILELNRRHLNQLKKVIEEDINFNNARLRDEQTFKEAIEESEEEKARLLAQTDGFSELELQNIYQYLKNWYRYKNDGEKEKPVLELQINKLQENLDEFNTEYDKFAVSTSAKIYSQINVAFKKIKRSFEYAKEINTQNFLNQLEEKSNNYLEKLNTEGFRGIIKIEENHSGGAEIRLSDKDGFKVHDPNTALETTMYMSVLFAISELTTLTRENDYPLIFDAPTSSFSDAKEVEFFNVISDVDKQCIIFTKSFLKADGTGKNYLDEKEIKKLKGKLYLIKKQEPFDNTDLSTIRMSITEVKY